MAIALGVDIALDMAITLDMAIALDLTIYQNYRPASDICVLVYFTMLTRVYRLRDTLEYYSDGE